jgi:hypothetical protein
MIRNRRFHETLKEFCEAALNLLEEKIKLGDRPPVDVEVQYEVKKSGWSSRTVPVIEWHWFTHAHTENFKGLEAYKAVSQAMEQDETISRHLNTLVGTVESSSRVETDDFLDSVLNRLLRGRDGTAFHEDEFNKLYERIENFFYTDTLRFRVLAPLYRFEMEPERIELRTDLSLISLTQEEKNTFLKEAQERHLGPAHEVSEYAIELFYSSPKIIGERTNPPSTLPSQQVRQKFDEVLSALRLFKNGRIVYFNTYSKELNWPVGGSVYHLSHPVSWPGQTYTLSAKEATEFLRFWQDYRQERREGHNRIEVALRRLNFGYERMRPEDRLIDYIIGFEALLLGDQPDLRYKLGLRGAALLGETAEQRERTFNELSEAYKKRSEFVHGGNPKAVAKIGEEQVSLGDFVDMIEDRLRSAIKKFLQLCTTQTEKQIIQSLDEKLIRGS